jgi:hypothetical protein
MTNKLSTTEDTEDTEGKTMQLFSAVSWLSSVPSVVASIS